MTPEFSAFRKIPRLSRNICLTEKLDGTNASVYIVDRSQQVYDLDGYVATIGDYAIYAGKRTSWCNIKQDNHGFASWVYANAEELITLGTGHHFGEWWGQGIQRRYGLEEKRFSLFNVSRWDNPEDRPRCCDIVPTIYRGMFSQEAIDAALEDLKANGSKAASGFMKPEGIIVYHCAAGIGFKKTLEKDEMPKSISGL